MLRTATVGFICASLLYIGLSQKLTSRTELRLGRRREWRLVSRTLLQTGIVIVLASVAAPSLPLVSARERFTLREYRTPPFDPTVLSSPLADFRKYLTPEAKDRVLFEASGDLPTRWRLATLNAYDGRVWSVGTDEEASGQFEHVGARLDAGARNAAVGPTRRTSVRLVTLRDPWLPMAGKGERLSMPASVRSRVRHNETTDVLVWSTGEGEQTQYELTWRDVPTANSVEPGAMVDASTGADLSLPSDVPDQITQAGFEAVEGATSDGEKVVQLRSLLQAGYYSLNTRPGHTYGDLIDLLAEPARMVGNEEQYTAAFAVLARAVRLPSRVVVGFEPPKTSSETVQIRGRDIRAWAEVRFADGQWVQVDVSPPKSRRPQPRTAQSEDRVDAPPPQFDPIPQPVDQAGSQIGEDKKPKATTGSPKSRLQLPAAVLAGVGLILAPTLICGVALAAVVGLKSQRRRRRRSLRTPGLRIAGAWHELQDRLEEHGTLAGSKSTFRETAASLSEDDPHRTAVMDLSLNVERAMFHPVEPTAIDADAVWAAVDSLRSAIRGNQTRWRRLRCDMSLGTLSQQRSPRRLGGES